VLKIDINLEINMMLTNNVDKITLLLTSALYSLITLTSIVAKLFSLLADNKIAL
jgi:protoheme ferro-lyase